MLFFLVLPNAPATFNGTVDVDLSNAVAHFVWDEAVRNGPLTTFYIIQQVIGSGLTQVCFYLLLLV